MHAEGLIADSLYKHLILVVGETTRKGSLPTHPHTRGVHVLDMSPWGLERSTSMTAIKDSFAAQKLAQMRDELKVKMHLAKADARKEWEKLEAKWQEFERKGQAVENATEQSRQEIQEALGELSRELKEGYERIRKAI